LLTVLDACQEPQLSGLLIGHITKEGSLAGQRLWSTSSIPFLYFEGERHHNHRIVRATKNRFGAANEVGVFEMTSTGLIPCQSIADVFARTSAECCRLNCDGVYGRYTTDAGEIQALCQAVKYGTGNE
jgi:DNA repair protein RadA/Sms